MGYMTQFEQRNVKELYGRTALYRCDACTMPIYLDSNSIPVVDPKGGYKKKREGTPDFIPREPKRTYHQICDDELIGRKRKPKVQLTNKSVAEVAAWVLETIKKKPDADWRVRKLLKIYPGTVAKLDMRMAVRQLRKEKKLKRVAGHIVLVEVKDGASKKKKQKTKK